MNGHAPSLSDLQTDSTSGGLDVDIGVTILKRSGQELRVVMDAIFFSSNVGMEVRGGAVSVDVGEGVLEGAPCDQRKPCVHLGHCHHSMCLFYLQVILLCNISLDACH